jgi:hypothetical protein
MAKDCTGERSSSDRIAMDEDRALDGLESVCKDFGWSGKDKANTIFDLLLRIKKEDILCSRSNINGKNLHNFQRGEALRARRGASRQ